MVEAVKAVPAHPVLMEVIPDGFERDVALNCKCGLIPAPPRMVAEMQQPVQRGKVPYIGPTFVQSDGLHPNTRAQRLIAHEVLTVLLRELHLPTFQEADFS